jgi:hypothetical protein
MPKLTVDEYKKLLGPTAERMTDSQVESERDQMEALAHLIYDLFTEEMKRDPERVRRLIHAHKTGEVAS